MDKGKKRAIVLVPGMFSLGCVYHQFGDKLELYRKTIVINFPMKEGHLGYVYSGPCELDFGGKLKYLLSVLQELNGAYDILGHSAGAPLVLRAAMEKGVNPRRIFLVSPAPIYGVFHLYPSVIRSFWFVLKDPLFSYKSIRIPYEKFCWSMSNTLTDKVSRKIYLNLREESGQFISQVGLWFLDTSKKSTQIKPELIRCPVDIFVGTKDRVTPSAVAKGIKRFLEGASEVVTVRLFQFKGCSHWLLEECQKELIQRLEAVSFLDK